MKNYYAEGYRGVEAIEMDSLSIGDHVFIIDFIPREVKVHSLFDGGFCYRFSQTLSERGGPFSGGPDTTVEWKDLCFGSMEEAAECKRQRVDKEERIKEKRIKALVTELYKEIVNSDKSDMMNAIRESVRMIEKALYAKK